MILSTSLPDCALERVVRSDSRLVIVAYAQRVLGRCPTCVKPSFNIHRRYERRPADPSSVGQLTSLRLHIQRFYCLHPTCRRRTFAEPFLRLLPPRARRTRRLAQARFGLGLQPVFSLLDPRKAQENHFAVQVQPNVTARCSAEGAAAISTIVDTARLSGANPFATIPKSIDA